MTINGRHLLAMSERTVVLQNAAAGTGNGTALTLDEYTESVLIVVQGASVPSMTLQTEISRDGGSTYYAGYAQDLINTVLAFVTQIAVANTTELRYYYVPHPGANRLRVRVSALVTGTVTVTAIERRRA